ncbi:hypothetical protein UA08_06534 [Talaromyces atroroseus]|uniref:Uncharacterized protein n=1 Tax=Talaromyces atroroseus TaxID=1441469 RepID=A0A225ARK1_TALAT|nr:hypothetical protein UA08_06534 [Talaromyces atroroseus]OKL58209.1 hypothetical protein UA08_06534 [Talaromyces atroroseus]
MSSQDGLSDGAMAFNAVRSRKRPAASISQNVSSPNGQNQSFFFVDPASSTREKRAHVMRHHIQTKRKQNMLATQTDRQSCREPRVFPWMIKSGGNGIGPNPRPIRKAVSTTTPPPSHTYLEPDHRSSGIDQTPDLKTDYLATLAYDASVPWAEDQLIDMWTSRLTYWSGQNEHLKAKILQAAVRHRITFEAVILGYCSRWALHLSHSSDDSVFRHYESRVRQAIINKTDRGGIALDDDTISLALVGLALQEERFGDKDKAREYARQAKDLQVHRKSRPIDAVGRPVLLYFLAIMEPPTSGVSLDEASKLVDFLHVARQSMEKDATSHYLREVPQRSAVFQYDSPLFQLLSSGPRPSQVPIDRRFFVVNKNVPTTEWARTAGLIYVMLSLYDFCGEKRKVIRFLEYLQQLIQDYGLDRNPACESFLYLLLEETFSADLRDPERAWRANEILDIHKRLPFELQFRFNELLLDYLMLNPSVTTVEAFERDVRAIVHSEVC